MTTIHATWSDQLSNFAKKLCIAKIFKSTGIEENKNTLKTIFLAKYILQLLSLQNNI